MYLHVLLSPDYCRLSFQITALRWLVKNKTLTGIVLTPRLTININTIGLIYLKCEGRELLVHELKETLLMS